MASFTQTNAAAHTNTRTQTKTRGTHRSGFVIHPTAPALPRQTQAGFCAN